LRTNQVVLAQTAGCGCFADRPASQLEPYGRSYCDHSRPSGPPNWVMLTAGCVINIMLLTVRRVAIADRWVVSLLTALRVVSVVSLAAFGKGHHSQRVHPLKLEPLCPGESSFDAIRVAEHHPLPRHHLREADCCCLVSGSSCRGSCRRWSFWVSDRLPSDHRASLPPGSSVAHVLLFWHICLCVFFLLWINA
jgi:hypothetical protein